MQSIEHVLEQYDIGTVIKITPIAIGLIHQTHRVDTKIGSFILQKLHPKLASEEIATDMFAVTEHLALMHFPAPQMVLTKDGTLLADADGDMWRMQTGLPGRSFDTIEDSQMAHSAGELLGRFHVAMTEFTQPLQTKRQLHNTPAVLAALQEAVSAHKDEKAANEVREDILFVEETLPKLFLPTDLPKRIIHGDPKISNFLFEEGEAIALVDLDTCTLHTPLVELGDAFRSWCGRKEDNADNMFNIEIFNAGLQGYLKETEDFLSPEEEILIPQSIGLITLELAARFLTDYFKDEYFGWDNTKYESRRQHNLARARGQISLFKHLALQLKLNI